MAQVVITITDPPIVDNEDGSMKIGVEVHTFAYPDMPQKHIDAVKMGAAMTVGWLVCTRLNEVLEKLDEILHKHGATGGYDDA